MRAAVRTGAGAHVPAVAAFGGGAAGAAETVPAVPVEDAAGIGEDGALAAVEDRAHPAQLDEPRALRRLAAHAFIEGGDVGREAGPARLVETEEDDLLAAFEKRRTRRKRDRLRQVFGDQAAASPYREDAAGRIGKPLALPKFVAPQQFGAIEGTVGVVQPAHVGRSLT